MTSMNDFLPVCRDDMNKRGWDELDFLYIVGDAYVDHPSFGHAIISRVLESHGYKVGIVALPDWHTTDDIVKMGRPRLAVLVSAGNIDSMVNHYTAAKKRRNDDMYAPGGKWGMRPDRATIVYTNLAKQAFGKDMPVLIGGVEASLRRFEHYDYWSDKIRRSILLDSKADLLMYGMGEKQIVEIADCLDSGMSVHDITYIKGTCYMAAEYDEENSVLLPSYEECTESKEKYAISCREQYYEQNPYTGKTLVQKHGNRYLIQNPPMEPLMTEELDEVYDLPYMKAYHPMYEAEGGIPAISEVKFSLAANRGCFGSCNFCALAFHQGRIVTSRSDESLIKEATEMTKMPDFKGYIHDVGGPTANFRGPACDKQLKVGACKNKQCLYPKPCDNMRISHKKYLNLLRKLRQIKGVKKVFIRSGIRFDYLINDKNEDFFYDLCKHHVSGQLKVAPEHVSDNVLKYMGKPENSVFNRFSDKFYEINNKIGKKQYLVPYLMSSHPGSTLHDAIKLAQYLNEHNINPQQVQDFYPTPGTISTCMFYTELDPFTMKKVFVPKTAHEKAMQRALLQYRNPDNYKLVYEALTKAGRTDLIGYQQRCLLRPKGHTRPPQGNILNENTRRKENGKAAIGKGSFGKNKGRTPNRGRGTQKTRNKSRSGGNHRR